MPLVLKRRVGSGETLHPYQVLSPGLIHHRRPFPRGPVQSCLKFPLSGASGNETPLQIDLARSSFVHQMRLSGLCASSARMKIIRLFNKDTFCWHPWHLCWRNLKTQPINPKEQISSRMRFIQIHILPSTLSGAETQIQGNNTVSDKEVISSFRALRRVKFIISVCTQHFLIKGTIAHCRNYHFIYLFPPHPRGTDHYIPHEVE